MTPQSFTIAFKEALWKAHNCKCIYCEESLLFVDLEIDHVVPRSSTSAQLDDRRQRLGLSPDFNKFGIENCAPACRPCNRKKRDFGFADGFLSIVLTVIEEKIPKIKKLMEGRKAERTLDNMFREIMWQIEAGIISRPEVVRRLDFVRDKASRMFDGGIEERYLQELVFSPPPIESGRKLMFLKHARERMRERGIDVDHLNNKIYDAVKAEDAVFQLEHTPRGNKLYITVDNQLEVVCLIKGKVIRVITVGWLDKQ